MRTSAVWTGGTICTSGHRLTENGNERPCACRMRTVLRRRYAAEPDEATTDARTSQVQPAELAMSGEFEMRSDRTSNDGKYRIWTCASAHGCGATAVSGLYSSQFTLIVPHSHETGSEEIRGAALSGSEKAPATAAATDSVLSETDALNFLASFEAVASAEGSSASSETFVRDGHTPESGISTLGSAGSEQGDRLDNSTEASSARAESEATISKSAAPPADVVAPARRRIVKKHANCSDCSACASAMPRRSTRKRHSKPLTVKKTSMRRKRVAHPRTPTSKPQPKTAVGSGRPSLLAKYFSHTNGLSYHCQLCDKLVQVVKVGANKRSLTGHLRELHVEQYKEFNRARGHLVKQGIAARKLNASHTATPPVPTSKSPAEGAVSRKGRPRRLLEKYFERIWLTHYECKMCEALVTVGKRDDGTKVTRAGHLKEHHEREFQQFVRARRELARKANELNRSRDDEVKGSPAGHKGLKRRASDSAPHSGTFKMRRCGASVEVRTLFVGKRIEKSPLSLEILVEVFRSLQRGDLDVLQIVSRTFSGCVEAHTTTFALRLIKHARIWRDTDECFAHLRRATESAQRDLSEFGVWIPSAFRSESPFVKFSGFHPNDVLAQFFAALRWSKVARIEIGSLTLDDAFLETKDAAARSVRVSHLEYKNTALGNDGIALASLFSGFAAINTVDLCGSPALFPLVSDSLVTAFGNTKHSSLFLPQCDDNSRECAVSEDAITRYCFTRPLGSKKYRALRVKSPKLSRNFVKRVVELHRACRHTGSFAFTAYFPLPEQDISELELFLSWKPLGSFVLEFPGDVRLQVIWNTHHNCLQVRRGVEGKVRKSFFDITTSSVQDSIGF